MREQKTTIRYSSAFKKKVVSEIESGKLNANEARRIYGIGGGMTIENWIRKLGKNELLSRIVRVEMKNEADELKKLKKELDKVKIALADERLKVLAYESLIEVADEHFGTDIKKNFGSKPAKEASAGTGKK